MCRYPVGKLKESEQERPAEVSKRKEQVGQFFAKLTEMQDAEQFEVREFVAQGVKVVVLGHYRWRVKFPRMGSRISQCAILCRPVRHCEKKPLSFR